MFVSCSHKRVREFQQSPMLIKYHPVSGGLHAHGSLLSCFCLLKLCPRLLILLEFENIDWLVCTKICTILLLYDFIDLIHRTDNFMTDEIWKETWKTPNIMWCASSSFVSHVQFTILSPSLLKIFVDRRRCRFRLAERSHVGIFYPQRTTVMRSMANQKLVEPFTKLSDSPKAIVS